MYGRFQDGNADALTEFKYSTEYGILTDESIDIRLLREYNFKMGFIKKELKKRHYAKVEREVLDKAENRGLRRTLKRQLNRLFSIPEEPVLLGNMQIKKVGNNPPIKAALIPRKRVDKIVVPEQLIKRKVTVLKDCRA